MQCPNLDVYKCVCVCTRPKCTRVWWAVFVLFILVHRLHYISYPQYWPSIFLDIGRESVYRPVKSRSYRLSDQALYIHRFCYTNAITVLRCLQRTTSDPLSCLGRFSASANLVHPFISRSLAARQRNVAQCMVDYAMSVMSHRQPSADSSSISCWPVHWYIVGLFTTLLRSRQLSMVPNTPLHTRWPDPSIYAGKFALVKITHGHMQTVAKFKRSLKGVDLSPVFKLTFTLVTFIPLSCFFHRAQVFSYLALFGTIINADTALLICAVFARCFCNYYCMVNEMKWNDSYSQQPSRPADMQLCYIVNVRFQSWIWSPPVSAFTRNISPMFLDQNGTQNSENSRR